MKRWTTADGLPHNWISAILQTGEGYIWLGTNNAGLVRFDGLTFKTFNLLNTPALPSDTITKLHEDGDGTLWIGTVAGLVRYRDGAFRAERLDDVLSHQVVMDLRSDREGRLWVAAEREVIRRDGNTWTIVLREIGVQRLSASSDGKMWIATQAALIEWRDGVRRTFTVRDGLPGGDLLALLQDREGHLWIGSTTGLAHLDAQRDGAKLERTILADARISALFEDSDGTLWIGGRNRVYARAPDGTLTESTPLESGNGAVAVMIEDREGHICRCTRRR